MNEGMRTCGRPSRGRYASGCRCNACKSANDQYEYERVRGTRYMTTPMETEKARRKVQGWRDMGFGLRTIAAVTGVHRSTLQTLMSGNHANCNGPTRRMKLECYEQIMECGIRKGELVICNPVKYEAGVMR